MAHVSAWNATSRTNYIKIPIMCVCFCLLWIDRFGCAQAAYYNAIVSTTLLTTTTSTIHSLLQYFTFMYTEITPRCESKWCGRLSCFLCFGRRATTLAMCTAIQRTKSEHRRPPNSLAGIAGTTPNDVAVDVSAADSGTPKRFAMRK